MFGRERRGLRRPPLWGKGPRWAFIRLFPEPRSHLQRVGVLRKPALQASCPLWGGVGPRRPASPGLSTPVGLGLGWEEEAPLSPGPWPAGVGQAWAAGQAVTERSL